MALNRTYDEVRAIIANGQCCAGVMGAAITKGLNNGKSMTCEQKELTLLILSIWAVLDYDPDLENCLSDDQVEAVLENILKLCNCFRDGFPDIPLSEALPQRAEGFILLENGAYVLLEDGGKNKLESS